MITLNLTEDQARLIWCQLIRARKIAVAGINQQNIAALAEGFAWFDSSFDKIAKSVSGGMNLGAHGLPINPATGQEIDGNETNKP